MERIAESRNPLRYAKWAGILFVGLFVLQMAYQAMKGSGDRPGTPGQGVFESTRKNYASYSKKEGGKPGPAQPRGGHPGGAMVGEIIDKYEKIARLGSRSSSFDEDRQRLSQALAAQKAVIQFESLQGLGGTRTYYLSAGVPPELFDAAVEALRQIGTPSSLSIEKTDKTSEYLALLERRASLERTRASLAALKTKGGSMDEFLKLENRLLEIEEQLRDTGLSIGQFNAENEFCTVQFTLREKEGFTVRKVGHLAVDAFLWALALFAMLLFMGAAGAVALWAVLGLRNRFRTRLPGQGP